MEFRAVVRTSNFIHKNVCKTHEEAMAYLSQMVSPILKDENQVVTKNPYGMIFAISNNIKIEYYQ
jgi:hypothetical protein